jgi:membrane-bound lytic murein transglycosylase B
MNLPAERIESVAGASRAPRLLTRFAMVSRIARGLLPWSLALLGVTVPVASASAQGAAPLRYDQRPETRAFIAELVDEYSFDRRELGRLFAHARYQPRIVAAMSRPVLSPPKWYEYAPQFLNAERVDGGLAFWRDNAATLARAQSEFGVPAEVIVAIIGVETFYGRNTGGYRVFDALTTLAFDYPRRGDFFRNELKQFLLLARDEGISPLVPRGSYAGAYGLPQFMPGSVRAYAVDYDGDGRIDLSADAADAIGSVGNFLARHDWRRGAPVLEPAQIDPAASDAVLRALDGGVSERRPRDAWMRDGVGTHIMPADPGSDPVALLMLEEADGPSYWLAFGNWYVLTRYNRSRLYATAVWQLAQALVKARDEATLAARPSAPVASPVNVAPAASELPSAGDTAH